MTGASVNSSRNTRSKAKASDPPVFRPGAPDVVAAVESLYADEVRPQGRILLKRLAEIAAGQRGVSFATVSHPGLPDDLPRIDAHRLRKVCERCRQIDVQEEESGEYCALLAGRPARFVDACANGDDYPPEMWLAAERHFASPCCKDMVLPGGRYACAQALKAIELPFLAGFSLGRLCHIVQLAISRRHILGYLNGHVVPYWRSEAVVKERCAKQQQQAVLGPRSVPSLPLATLEQVREGLLELLADQPGKGAVSVPLPNIKRLFRSRFNLDLSETALGSSRLCELLQDHRFMDVCEVHLQGNGYVVTKSSQPLCLEEIPAPCAEQSLAPGSPESWPAYSWAKPVAPIEEPAPVPSSPEGWPVYQEKAKACPLPAVAEAVAAAAFATAAPPCSPPRFQAPSEEDIERTTASSRERSPEHCAVQRMFSDSASSTAAPESPTPTMLPLWPFEWAVGDVLEHELSSPEPSSPAPLSALGLCEELGEEIELAAEQAPPASTPSILRGGEWSALMSPSVLSDEGCIGGTVKNTFIHFSASSSSPLQSRHRSRSVPRDFGSARNEWETTCHEMLFRNKAVASAAAPPAEAAAQPARQLCWSPTTPGADAGDSAKEALRLWGCDALEVAASPKPAPWRPTLRHHAVGTTAPRR